MIMKQKIVGSLFQGILISNTFEFFLRRTRKEMPCEAFCSTLLLVCEVGSRFNSLSVSFPRKLG